MNATNAAEGGIVKLADVHPDTAGSELSQTAHALVRRLGRDVVIASRADVEQAVLDRVTISDAIRSVKELFDPLKAVTHQAHATVCAREREILAPLLALDAARRTAISAFKARDDREREQREQQLAEQQRREQQSRAAATAAALEAAGQPEIAAAVLDEAIAAPLAPVVLPSNTQHVPGLKFRRSWKWRYAGGPMDVSATPDAIVQRTLKVIPPEFTCVDEAKLGQYARAMKSAGNIPGIEFYSVDEPVR